ncbi:MAG: RNA polymerase sigma factor, partial [Methyloceanibacter sp.]
MQAQDFHDSVRPGLVTIVPRLRRFANLLVGDRREGSALLARALRRMLAEQHRYQRGTALEVWAFAEIYRHWLHELRAHADPMTLTRTDDQGFEQLFHVEEEDGYLDRLTASFLAGLPPPQRLALLLVYGEGFDYA